MSGEIILPPLHSRFPMDAGYVVLHHLTHRAAWWADIRTGGRSASQWQAGATGVTGRWGIFQIAVPEPSGHKDPGPEVSHIKASWLRFPFFKSLLSSIECPKHQRPCVQSMLYRKQRLQSRSQMGKLCKKYGACGISMELDPMMNDYPKAPRRARQKFIYISKRSAEGWLFHKLVFFIVRTIENW